VLIGRGIVLEFFGLFELPKKLEECSGQFRGDDFCAYASWGK
jgi:hypothetical protein